MPAIAMTKNIPVVPDSPNFRRTTDEIMIVSIVIPETGLRAVVAIALAATEVKKNEKTSIRTSAIADDRPRGAERAEEGRDADRVTIVPRSIVMIEMSRSVRSSRRAPRRAGTP